MDFTLAIYKSFLQTLQDHEYHFFSFKDFISLELQNAHKFAIVLRHDVDRLPNNALELANIERSLGINGTYYFRIVPESYDEPVIKKIAAMDHEIGYHYEDLALAKGDMSKAISLFEKHLEHIRQLYPVKTLCMHGSPLSKWDNRDLWAKYKYRDFGLIAEPYFDVNYSKVFYITDTGRGWNRRVSVRDNVDSGFNIPIRNTKHIIQLVRQNKMPNLIMINIHPHRWFNPGYHWAKELVFQNAKNIIKKLIIHLKW